jgi:hypothetical protein
MGYTLKDTHTLAHINGGLHALRRALAARIPDDFDWTFQDDGASLRVSYVWTGAGDCEFQEEVEADSARALLIKWQAINWGTERRKAERCTAKAS